MDAYKILARFYDRLNTADYDDVAAFLQTIFDGAHLPAGASLLDLACGTGKLSCLFAAKGYDMIAVDISPDMLTEARAAADKAGVLPLFLCQDMCNLDLYGTVDAGFCLFDSINYLKTVADLFALFDRLKYFIAPGGLFVFDINTRAKFEKVYGDNTFVFDEPDLFCTWQNHYRPRQGTCDFYLTFFVKEPDGRYHRFFETQRERLFSAATLRAAIGAGGFEIVGIYSDCHFSPADKESDRLYYVIRRRDGH